MKAHSSGRKLRSRKGLGHSAPEKPNSQFMIASCHGLLELQVYLWVVQVISVLLMQRSTFVAPLNTLDTLCVCTLSLVACLWDAGVLPASLLPYLPSQWALCGLHK